MTDEVFIVMV